MLISVYLLPDESLQPYLQGKVNDMGRLGGGVADEMAIFDCGRAVCIRYKGKNLSNLTDVRHT